MFEETEINRVNSAKNMLENMSESTGAKPDKISVLTHC